MTYSANIWYWEAQWSRTFFILCITWQFVLGLRMQKSKQSLCKHSQMTEMSNWRDPGNRDHISDWKCLESNSLQTMENLPICRQLQFSTWELQVAYLKQTSENPKHPSLCRCLWSPESIMLEDLHKTELWERLKMQMVVADAFSRAISPYTLDGENFWAKVLIS